jgi:hypothetical protein
MHCRSCGINYDVARGDCPRCGTSQVTRQIASSGRRWVIAGISLFLVSGLVLISTFYYVENRRAQKLTLVKTNSSIAQTLSINKELRLQDLTPQQWLELIPLTFREKFVSPGGEAIPDELRLITTADAEYLVVFGLQSINSKKVKTLMLFKWEGGSLANISPQALPSDFPQGQVCSGAGQLKFYPQSSDILISQPASLLAVAPLQTPLIKDVGECDSHADSETNSTNDQNMDAGICEQAYTIQELYWCGSDYQLGQKRWRNDPYTIFYLVANALENKKLSLETRLVVPSHLELEITQGFERDPGFFWTARNLTTDDAQELRLVNEVVYALTNGKSTIKITITKIDNWWQVTSIERTTL